MLMQTHLSRGFALRPRDRPHRIQLLASCTKRYGCRLRNMVHDILPRINYLLISHARTHARTHVRSHAHNHKNARTHTYFMLIIKFLAKLQYLVNYIIKQKIITGIFVYFVIYVKHVFFLQPVKCILCTEAQLYMPRIYEHT